MTIVVLDALTRTDAQRCAELEAQLFAGDDPWPAKAFVTELGSPHTHYVAARAGDTLVGYAGMARLGRTPPFEYEIHTIAVDPVYQGHGIGRRLLAQLLERADGAVFLEVRTDNEAAIGLYRSAGFVIIGLRRRYYRASGADAYTMRREPQSSAPRREPQSSAPRREPQSSAPRREPRSSAPRCEPQSSAPRREPQSSAPRCEPQSSAPRWEPQSSALPGQPI